MSNRWLGYVFKRSPSRGGARLVLLALADRANHAGQCWPSLADTAERTRLSVRRVRACVRQLVATGELKIVKPGGGVHSDGRGRPNTYQLVALSPRPGNGHTRSPASGFTAPRTRPPATANPDVSRSNPDVLSVERGRAQPGKQQEPTAESPESPQQRCDVAPGAAAAVTDPDGAAFKRTLAERRADEARRRGGRTPKPLGSDISAVAGVRPGPAPRRRRGRIPDDEQQRTYELLRTVPELLDADARDLSRIGTEAEFRAALGAMPSDGVRNVGGWLRWKVTEGWTRSGSPLNGAEAARGGPRRGEVVPRVGSNAPWPAERFPDAT